jgi:diketogulonate reductase-like aldo/keto reductase
MIYGHIKIEFILNTTIGIKNPSFLIPFLCYVGFKIKYNLLKMNQLYSTLNNGVQMPLLGLGVYDMYQKTAEHAIETAIEIGYRLFDTASMYRNEAEVGNAIRNSGIPRQDVFITTKVNNTDHGYEETLKAFDISAQKIDCQYIDLYLIHWGIRFKRKDTWRALEKLYHEGRVRAIGVCNYAEPFLAEMQDYAQITPVVNQVEFSPYLYLKDLHAICQSKQILLQAWSPLVRGTRMHDPKLLQLAQKYGKSPAQILIRWGLDLGISTIPKSVTAHRLKENFDVFDFKIAPSDMAWMGKWHENLRVFGEDPMLYF